MILSPVNYLNIWNNHYLVSNAVNYMRCKMGLV